MYKRKTKDKYFIGHQVGFNGKKELLPIEFETEELRDKKLAELNSMVEDSKNNLILNPFGWLNRYWSVSKRVPLSK